MKRDTRIVALFVSAIPVVILGAASLCSWALSHGASASWRLLFRVLCHGMVTRSFTLFDVPMPICARCTGIYLGLLAGVVAYSVWPRVEERVARYGMFLMALPVAIDGVTQALRWRESTNGLRVVTGFAAAFVFGSWVLSAVQQRAAREFTTS